MFEKYPLIVSRYEELSEAIVQPDIIADTARYQAYLKERAALDAPRTEEGWAILTSYEQSEPDYVFPQKGEDKQ